MNRAEHIDEQCFKFLNEQGYAVKKPYTKAKMLNIRKQLSKDGKKLLSITLPKSIKFNGENLIVTLVDPQFCLVDINKKKNL